MQQFPSIFTGICPDFSGHSSFLCNVYKLLCKTLCLLSITKDGLFVYTSTISAYGGIAPTGANPTGSGYLPEGAEPTEQFHARCADSLMKLFEYMIRMDVTEAACVTHGGVIMSMLSQRAVPTRRPEQWMADPGCGYTVQTDVQLWMRDRLVEAIDIVPFGYADTLQGQAEAEENEAYE